MSLSKEQVERINAVALSENLTLAEACVFLLEGVQTLNHGRRKKAKKTVSKKF